MSLVVLYEDFIVVCTCRVLKALTHLSNGPRWYHVGH